MLRGVDWPTFHMRKEDALVIESVNTCDVGKFIPDYPAYTEGRSRVVNTPASYSGGREFKSRPRLQGYPDRFFLWFYSVLPGKYRESSLKLGHDRFLPDSSQFIVIHLSPYHRRYVVKLFVIRTSCSSSKRFASYLGGSEFKTRTGLYWLRFMVFLSSSWKCRVVP
jgi:hypothetical protein